MTMASYNTSLFLKKKSPQWVFIVTRHLFSLCSPRTQLLPKGGFPRVQEGKGTEGGVSAPKVSVLQCCTHLVLEN